MKYDILFSQFPWIYVRFKFFVVSKCFFLFSGVVLLGASASARGRGRVLEIMILILVK